ncbi:MAG: sulfatase [Gemmatimonadales bacterium]
MKRLLSPATRSFALLLLLGLLTGLIEGGYLALQQRVLHHLTFASVDALWMAPVAYALLFGLLAVPAALLARLAPGWCTTRVILGLGLTIVTFSLLLLWTGLLLSVYALMLMSVGVGVQLGRMLAPLVERHQRRLLPLTAMLLCLTGAVALAMIAGERWRRSSGADSATLASAASPNVLLVILDTVRAASLGLYGYERPTTPRLEEFAKGGVVFDSAYTVAPWTLPSHASLFTGLYHQDLSTDWLTPLDGVPRTLAEAFGAGGYATGGFVGNLPYTGRESGLARGFDTYRDHKLTPLQLFLSSTLFGTVREWWLFGNRRAHRDDDRKEGPRVTAEFLSWLDQRGPSPFFVFLNYFDAHLPLPGIPSGSAWDSGRRKLDIYDGAIARLDGYMGAMLDSLAARGVLDQTLVIIVSDHGTLLGEHGLTAHGNSLYQILLHVPLVIRGPGVPAGLRVGTPVSLRDLAETVRHTAGLAQAAPFPGRSLQPLWQSQPAGPLSPLLAQVRKGVKAPPQEPIRLGTMTSLILNGQHYVLGGRGKEELFDLGRDPAEDHNLAPEAGSLSVLDELRDSLRTLKHPGWAGAPEVPLHGTPGAPGS